MDSPNIIVKADGRLRSFGFVDFTPVLEDGETQVVSPVNVLSDEPEFCKYVDGEVIVDTDYKTQVIADREAAAAANCLINRANISEQSKTALQTASTVEELRTAICDILLGREE